MATGGVYETADLGRAICGHGRFVGSFEGVGAVAGIRSIANGDDGVAPAVAQKTTGAVELVAVLAHGHSEFTKAKTGNGNVLLVRSLHNAADKATDLGNLAAGAIAGFDFAADFEARNIECRGIVAHTADGAANAHIAIKRLSFSDGRLGLAVALKRNRRSRRHAARNTTNVHVIAKRIITRDIRFARYARQ